jgi:hypothetical protein
MPPSKFIKPPQRRMGRQSDDERALVQTVAAQLPEPPSERLQERETAALSTLLRRDPETVKRWIADARQEVQARASRYGEIHLEAVEAALAEGEHETAAREARQMLERLADDDGRRVLDKEGTPATQGIQVILGFKLGGIEYRDPEG